ncbi:MAG TPA: PGPGW domain-containing protein [Bacteroidota bacterium]|nr:PGPGW domain-containing protein [Bacteroidota bacterium]
MIVLVVGYTVLFVGIALLVLPGPAFVVIPIGLTILATEVQWAKKILDKLKGIFKRKNEAEKKRKLKN